MHVFDMTLRIAESMGLGALIGFERQYRSRMAGLRTNALVAVGAALFVLLSAQGSEGGHGGARAGERGGVVVAADGRGLR